MIAAPPKTPIARPPKTGRTAKKYYTIHNFPNSIMAVKLHDYEHMNTCVVSFSTQKDALFVGKVIENHRAKTKEWPVFNFADLQSDNMFRVTNFTGSAEEVLTGNMYVQEWSEVDDLKFYCVAHFFDLITLNRLTPSKEGFMMRGSLFKFEADQAFYTQRLEYLFEKFNG
jgi:hypothetical protein